MYNIILEYFEQYPNSTMPQFHDWAGKYLGMSPEQADTSLSFLLRQLQLMLKAQGPSYHFGPPERYYSAPLRKPIGCKCHDLQPVTMHNAPFGWPKGDQDGHGYPPKGVCLPRGYGYPRM